MMPRRGKDLSGFAVRHPKHVGRLREEGFDLACVALVGDVVELSPFHAPAAMQHHQVVLRLDVA